MILILSKIYKIGSIFHEIKKITGDILNSSKILKEAMNIINKELCSEKMQLDLLIQKAVDSLEKKNVKENDIESFDRSSCNCDGYGQIWGYDGDYIMCPEASDCPFIEK